MGPTKCPKCWTLYNPKERSACPACNPSIDKNQIKKELKEYRDQDQATVRHTIQDMKRTGNRNFIPRKGWKIK